MTRFVEDQRARLARERAHAFARAPSISPEGILRTRNDRSADPRRDSAAIAAHGPGTGDTMPTGFAHRAHRREPGSLISGVPASLISATRSAAHQPLDELRARCSRSLCSCSAISARCCRRAEQAPRCGAYPRRRRRSAVAQHSRARAERSSRLPIGVAMTKSVPRRLAA